MTRQDFISHVQAVNKLCEEILTIKGAEYSPGDENVFHSFEQAALFLNQTPHQALAGMMVKHVASIYQLIDLEASGKMPPMSQWREKIKDTMCYLHLLLQLVQWYRVHNPGQFIRRKESKSLSQRERELLEKQLNDPSS